MLKSLSCPSSQSARNALTPLQARLDSERAAHAAAIAQYAEEMNGMETLATAPLPQARAKLSLFEREMKAMWESL